MKIGIGELLIVFIVALVVVGPDKLPEYARQLGKALSELRKTTAGLNDEIQKDIVAPLNEAAKPLVDAVEPLNETMTDIKKDMQKVSNTLNHPAEAVKESIKEKEENSTEPETAEDSSIHDEGGTV